MKKIEPEFWTIVAEIDWAKTCKEKDGDDRVKRMLLERYSPSKLKWLNRQHDYAVSVVSACLKTVDVDMWGDSRGDLIEHVVGLGKEEVEKVINNAALLVDRAEALDYEESFAYCLPHKGDHYKLSPDYYRMWAQRAKKDLQLAMWEANANDDVPKVVENLIEQLDEVSNWMARGDANKQQNALAVAWSALQKADGEAGQSRFPDKAIQLAWRAVSWGPKNLANDYALYVAVKP